MRNALKWSRLTVRSSRYMVFDKKSMPIVACKKKNHFDQKHLDMHDSCIISREKKSKVSMKYFL